MSGFPALQKASH